MKKNQLIKRIVIAVAILAIIGVVVAAGIVSGGEEGALNATVWALIPPVVAIGLALITKEVFSSLFLGILVGGLFYTGFQPEATVLHIYNNGFLASLTDGYNMGILIFLALLGAIVAMMNKSGGSAAFGRWASSRIRGPKGAQLSTIGLGCLIFIDDYFNCLTVGSVMQPVTDKHKISRAKLAYLIDATAAPVCIIAPISSWAAAVAGFVENEDGFSLFLRAIPYNYYALLTIFMMVAMVLLKLEFGSMARHERNARNGDLFTSGSVTAAADTDAVESKGTVWELVFPIVTLIVCCIIGMIYTGGFFTGTDLINAFSNCDASVGLALGSVFALVITILYYLLRKVLSFTELMECIPEGFKAMTSAILILVFAWTLKNMTDSLGAASFVEALVKSGAESILSILPAIVFLIGCLLAFATGTSWGTFGILIPIVVDAFSNSPELMIIAISACMGGAVCGDHCSPISDTTIMASAGAQCDHVNHVSTQLPYAIACAAVSFVAYLAAGFVRNVFISLIIAVALMCVALFLLKLWQNKKEHQLAA
ncbi:MAG: Na+/H+ antiporter NhaC family protein [Oscillospiraceae bacterium]|nr:Na+/H+ antiporter NhaC family protein [Oscillospiraceae bacterium]